jgi:cobalt transporter subunit CbtA
MLIRVLLAAIMAGALAGCFATAAQSYRIVPLILAAEEFEHAAAPDSGHEAHEHAHAGAAHEDSAWAPDNGLERMAYRLVSNIVVGVAFALILTAGILFSGQALSVGSGLLWGACGFVAFVLAPNLGLPPELPGMASADLASRQLWWLATVVTTAAGLWIFAFKRSPAWMALGVGLFVSMHLIGAPRADGGESGVPAELAAEFAVATVASSALFWLVLGGLLGWLVGRVSNDKNAGQMPA